MPNDEQPGREEHEKTTDNPRPKLDLSRSLGEAGHETEQLGFEDIPDTGPLDRRTEDNYADTDTGMLRDFVTEAPPISPLPRLPEREPDHPD